MRRAINTRAAKALSATTSLSSSLILLRTTFISLHSGTSSVNKRSSVASRELVMPLLVYPSSTCDICKDEYYSSVVEAQWVTPNGQHTPKTPHSINCGHVFCDSCLHQMRTHTSSVCPLCRVPYSQNGIVKLHVDKYTEDGYDSLAKEEVKIIRATVFGFEERAEQSMIRDLIKNAQDWLQEDWQSRSAGECRSEAVQAVWKALWRYREVLQIQLDFDDLHTQYANQLTAVQMDLDRAGKVEQALLETQQKLSEELIAEVSDTIKSPYQSKVDLVEEIRTLRIENRQLKARYLHTSNPLPAPPVPVDIDWLAPAPEHRPLGEVGPRASRRQLAAQPDDLRHATAGSRTIKASAQLKLPSMIPGAPASQRVVLDETTLNPLLVEGRPRPQSTYSQEQFSHLPAGFVVDAEQSSSRRTSTSTYRDERPTQSAKPPRSQPRPFPNAAAIENLPPAPGLGLFDSAHVGPSSARQSYNPAPMPGPGTQPASPTATLGQADPHWGDERRPHTSTSTAPLSSAISATGLYPQPAMLSDLDLTLNEMPAAIAQPAPMGASAASSLGDLSIVGLRNISVPVNAVSSRNSSATNLGAASSHNSSTNDLSRSRSSAEVARPSSSMYSHSRNASSSSVAPRMDRRRVSFDPEPRMIRRRYPNEDYLAEPAEVQPAPVASTTTSRPSQDTLGVTLSETWGASSGQSDFDYVDQTSGAAFADLATGYRRSHSTQEATYIVERSPRLSPVIGVATGAGTSVSNTLGNIAWDTRSRARSRPSSHVPQPEGTRAPPIPIASPRPVDARPPQVLDRDSDSTPVASGSGSTVRRRSSRRSSATPYDSQYHEPSAGSSLLLNFTPLGPGTSEATTASGEPSSIHAPRPSRHNSNSLGQWLPRNNH
ncbi:hypothetical protein EIP91_011509 [Steccherinum ochraceum]|uniref:RING-type domain-containing protein n=1 Tax=Steccherinum ochraceum TaxID=92696 RepID=A0A4R0RM94_9APHY|nr:hypothetical protein EIP91_011509 [Steccherinum ochraceum]